MAIIAILIRHGVADLAGKVTKVLLMLRITRCLGPNILVTVVATR